MFVFPPTVSTYREGKKAINFHRMQLETQVSIPDEIFVREWLAHLDLKIWIWVYFLVLGSGTSNFCKNLNMPKSGQYDILEIWKRNFLECSFYVTRGEFSAILSSLKPYGCLLPKNICFSRYWYEHISYRPKTPHNRFFACHFSFLENAPLKPQYFVRAPFLAMIARRIFGKCAIGTFCMFENGVVLIVVKETGTVSQCKFHSFSSTFSECWGPESASQQS